MRIGDVTQLGLQDIWSSEQRKEVMERLDPSKDCNFHCLRHETNVTIRDIKRQQEGGVEIVAVEEFDRFI